MQNKMNTRRRRRIDGRLILELKEFNPRSISRGRILGVTLLLTVMLVTFTWALAFHEEPFELDENAIAEAVEDWDLIYDGLDTALTSVFVADGDDFPGGVTVPAGLPDDDTTYFTTGGSKDVNNVDQWMHQTGDVAPDKDEILNAYAAAYSWDPDGFGPETPHLVLYFGLDRFANNGDAQVGFWFFENPIGLNSDGTFDGVHAVGDLLVLSHFTQGGEVDTIEVYRWVGPPDVDNLELITSGADCAAGSAHSDFVCAAVNDFTETAPWPYVAKKPVKGESDSDFPPGSFYEGGIDVTALGLEIGCGGSFLAETRSSQSLDAQLKDFALRDFQLCSANIQIEPDAVNEVGDDHIFTVTVNQVFAGSETPAGDGTDVDVTLTDSNGAISSVSSDNCDVDSGGAGTVNGECTVTFSSNSAGTVTGYAAATVTIFDDDFPVETDGTGDNS
ncbi:MAG: hypothetical protein ACXACH_05880, partial [Candidatus Hermodarchaeia archaeon]